MPLTLCCSNVIVNRAHDAAGTSAIAAKCAVVCDGAKAAGVEQCQLGRL